MTSIRKIQITPDAGVSVNQVVKETVHMLNALSPERMTASITFNGITFEVSNCLEVMALSAYDQAVSEAKEKAEEESARVRGRVFFKTTFGADSCGQ